MDEDFPATIAGIRNAKAKAIEIALALEETYPEASIDRRLDNDAREILARARHEDHTFSILDSLGDFETHPCPDLEHPDARAWVWEDEDLVIAFDPATSPGWSTGSQNRWRIDSIEADPPVLLETGKEAADVLDLQALITREDWDKDQASPEGSSLCECCHEWIEAGGHAPHPHGIHSCDGCSYEASVRQVERMLEEFPGLEPMANCNDPEEGRAPARRLRNEAEGVSFIVWRERFKGETGGDILGGYHVEEVSEPEGLMRDLVWYRETVDPSTVDELRGILKRCAGTDPDQERDESAEEFRIRRLREYEESGTGPEEDGDPCSDCEHPVRYNRLREAWEHAGEASCFLAGPGETGRGWVVDLYLERVGWGEEASFKITASANPNGRVCFPHKTLTGLGRWAGVRVLQAALESDARELAAMMPEAVVQTRWTHDAITLARRNDDLARAEDRDHKAISLARRRDSVQS